MSVLSFDKLVCTENDSLEIWERNRLLFLESASNYSSILDHDSPDVKSLLTSINSCFNESNKRWDGLRLLSVLVQQNLSTVVLENYRSWVQHLRKFILHDSDLKVRLLAVKILGKILCYCHSDSEHSRYLSTNVASHIIPQLAVLDNKWQLVAVYGFYYFLNYLPGPTKEYTSSIKRRLLETLNSTDFETVEISTLCIAKIAFTHVSNERGSTPSTSWLDLFQKLLNTLNRLLNFIYEDFELEQAVEVDDKQQIPLPLTLDCNDRNSIFVDSFSRCVSICLCLEKMLKIGEGSAVLCVPIENVLQVVSRILAVNAKSLMDNESAKQKDLLFTLLPMLHLNSLKVLEGLILCCRKHLLIHDQRIQSLLLQSLTWPSSVWKSEKTKSALSKLRISVYHLLIFWCETMGSSTDISRFSNAFLSQILCDAFYEQKQSEENITSTPVTVNKSKNKKRKVDQYLTFSNANKTGDLCNYDLCRSSLKALRILLCNCGDDFKSSEIKSLFTKVTGTLFKISSGVMDHSSCIHFSNIPCRKALYKLLLTLLTSQSFLSHELLSMSIQIFSNGCQDRNSQVAQFCLQAKSICHLLVEPIRRHLPMKVTMYPTVSEEEHAQVGKSSQVDFVETITEEDDVEMGNSEEKINEENASRDGHIMLSQSNERVEVNNFISDECLILEETSTNKENENDNIMKSTQSLDSLIIVDGNCKTQSLDKSEDIVLSDDSFDVVELYKEEKSVLQSDSISKPIQIDGDVNVDRIMNLFVLSAADENVS